MKEIILVVFIVLLSLFLFPQASLSAPIIGCGNGYIDPGDQCETIGQYQNKPMHNCIDFGYDDSHGYPNSQTVTPCNGCGYDTSVCGSLWGSAVQGPPPSGSCGDGRLNPGEQCDPSLPQTFSCGMFGFQSQVSPGAYCDPVTCQINVDNCRYPWQCNIDDCYTNLVGGASRNSRCVYELDPETLKILQEGYQTCDVNPDGSSPGLGNLYKRWDYELDRECSTYLPPHPDQGSANVSFGICQPTDYCDDALSLTEDIPCIKKCETGNDIIGNFDGIMKEIGNDVNGNGFVDVGDTVKFTVSVGSGRCNLVDYLQLDLQDASGTCLIKFSGGHISGAGVTNPTLYDIVFGAEIRADNITGEWLVTDIPANCQGKVISLVTKAELYEDSEYPGDPDGILLDTYSIPVSGDWQQGIFILGFPGNYADTEIISPPANTWVGPTYDFTVDVSDQGTNLQCFYTVWTGGVFTRDAIPRTCDTTQQITVGAGQDCRDHGVSACYVYTGAQDSTDPGSIYDIDSRVFNVDLTNPTFDSFSILGCDYTSGTDCWVNANTFTLHRIGHTDTGSLASHQYLSLTKDGCTPNSCAAGNEIKSYAYVQLPGGDVNKFHDWMVNDAYMNIIGASCSLPNCVGVETIQQDFTVLTGNTEGDFRNWVFMYDKVSNPVGYTATPWWYRIDNTLPTASIVIDSGSTLTTSTTVTLTLSSSDGRSGLNNMKCKIWNNGDLEPSWSACPGASTSWTIAGNPSNIVYYKVSDYVGLTFVASDSINYLNPSEAGSPFTNITSPEEHTWFNNNFNIDVNDTNADSCEFNSSTGDVPVSWKTRTCDTTASVWVGTGASDICSTEGYDQCIVYVRASNSSLGLDAIDYMNYSVDWTIPGFDGYSVTGCDYVKGNDCWVKVGTTTQHSMSFNDPISKPRRNNIYFMDIPCPTVSFCGDGNEVSAYVDVYDSHRFYENVQWDSLLDITDVTCTNGCSPGSVSVTERWGVTAGVNEHDLKIRHYVFDMAWNKILSDTGYFYKLDNTFPNGSIDINNDAPETFNRVVTLGLVSNDSRSGLKYCRIGYDNGTWEFWSRTYCNGNIQVTLPDNFGSRAIYFEVMDNVSHVMQTSDNIQYSPIGNSIGVDLSITSSYPPWATQIMGTLNMWTSDDVIEYKIWNQSDGEPANWQSIVSHSWSQPFSYTPSDGPKTIWTVVRNSTNDVLYDWDSRTLDTISPSCSVSSPASSTSPFVVSWSASNDINGIASYVVQTNRTGVWVSINYGNLPGDQCVVAGTQATCTVPAGKTYAFKCRARDVPGNWGNFGPEAWTTVVPSGGPNTYFTPQPDAMPDWTHNETTIWTGGNGDSGDFSFWIRWDTSENPDLVDCYQVQWKSAPNPTWRYVIRAAGQDLSCTQLEEINFGVGNFPEDLVEGELYTFRVRANNTFGEWGPWSTEEQTTIDVSGPIVTVVHVLGSVTTSSDAIDMISGIASNILAWDAGPFGSGSVDCGASAPAVSSYCENTVNGNSVRGTVTAFDNGGLSTVIFFSIGDMVEFLLNDLRLVLGGSHNLKALVRNIDDVTTNITLTLEGTYPMELSKFLDVSTHDYYTLSNSNQVLEIGDIEPDQEAIVYIQVRSSDIDLLGKVLTIRGQSLEGSVETDDIRIIVSYPALFPGLNDVAVLLLVIISVGLFYKINRKK
ncbi:MAG: fibronectin type III domain-containing protein [Candidatus Aenigmatarchaeota archaeon]